MPKIIDEKIVRTRKLLFWLGPFPAGIMALISFSFNITFPQEIIFLLMLVAFPAGAAYVALSWKLFNQGIKNKKS